MKKIVGFLIVVFLFTSLNSFSQEKKDKTTQKTTTEQTKKSESGDKVIAGKRGPNGEKVYEGAKGGQYYINKNGNKTYLKDEETVVAGKKGPKGETVYVGPKGGQYYYKDGNKVYLKTDKK